MKTTIKVRILTEGCEPVITDEGDWIDVVSAKDIDIQPPRKNKKGAQVSFSSCLIPLGFSAELEPGYEAHVKPRSSSYKRFGFIQTDGVSLIDNPYKGDDEEWHLPIVSMLGTRIPKGERIGQFKVTLSHKATFWQKLKWLFSSGVRIEFVKKLNNKPRGGFGSGTGNRY